jgi:hypothetical protein
LYSSLFLLGILLVDKNKKDKYLLYFGLLSFLFFIVGACAFILMFSFPSPVQPFYQFQSLIGTVTVTFPWINYLSIFGLVLLTVGTFARFLGFGKKDHVPRLLLVAIIIAILLTVFSLSIVPGNYLPPNNQLYPTPYPSAYPTASPYSYPTSDPNAFSITQRVTVEYVSTYEYYPPTSYKTTANIQSVITSPTINTHSISIWGTYKNWNFDVYVQVGSSDAFWEFADSGVTDGSGNGYADVPYFAYDVGQVHNIVAVINPIGGGVSPVSYGGFTAGELTGLVNDGTLRASNHLSFDVLSGFVL